MPVLSTIASATARAYGFTTLTDPFIDAALSLAFDKTTTLDNRITFTRATDGTYFNSSGTLTTASSGVARFDHRLESGVWVNKGLLIEETRTNNVQRSEEFNDNYWIKNEATITDNQTTAPDGTTTADKLFENTTNDLHFIYGPTSSFTSGTFYTLSIFAKKAERDFICLLFPSAAFGTQSGAIFNLNNGTFNLLSGLTSASSQDCGNGWYRCTISKAATSSSSTNNSFYFISNNSTSLAAYVGSNSNGIFIWGAQLEVGAFPTSYIKTTTASVTRNADVATMTSTNFSDWYNATEGTVYWQGDIAGTVDSAGNWLWNINNNAFDEQLFQLLFLSSGTYQIRSQVVDGGAGQLGPLVQTVSFTANQTYKTSFGYKINNFASSTDGSAAATDTSGSLPTVDRILLGSRVGGTNYLNGHIAKFYYWNTRKPNSFLQSVTG